MAKTSDEKLIELEQKIHRLQAEKKRLQRKKENDLRKKRDHAMILFGATFLTHYPQRKEWLVNASDEEIKQFAHSFFKSQSSESGAPYSAREAAETQHDYQAPGTAHNGVPETAQGYPGY